MSQPPPLVESISEEQAEELTAKLDVGSRIRKYSGPFGIIFAVVAATMSLFHLYTTLFGFFDAPIQRSIFLSFVMFLGYALYPLRYRPEAMKGLRFPPIWDLVLMALGVSAGAYIVVNYQDIVMNMGNPTQTDIIMGAMTILLVLELCRRAAGPVLTVVCAIFLLYALFGSYVPGFLGHRGYSFERVVSHMYLTTEGIFGIAAGVATTYVFMFILFGAFLLRTGTGQFIIDIAVSSLGNFSGGPAKVAVFASGLMGTINGSSVANVVGTGSFTIPLMKSIGYKPYFAGAVEAAASTGGQLMPPVMGAGAFLMAEITGIPYSQIIIAAALPAVLYYTGVLTGVHLEAKRTGLMGLPREQLISPWKVIKERGLLLVPVAAVVYMLLNGYTPPYAAIVGIGTSIVAGAILPTTRVHPRQYWEALVQGARDAVGVSVAILAIGFIMGSATLTGAGLKIANGILMLSGGNLFLTLVFTMFASLLLGMGLPTTANYLVTSTIAAPALVQAGVPLLPAHLFVFYFGIIADLTPPVALAAMAGAGIAGSKPLQTGVQAFKLGAPAYLIPYVFCYAPQITLIGYPFLESLQAAFTALLGVTALGISIMGWMFTNVPWWQRVPLFAAAFLMIVPGLQTDLMGLGLLGLVAFLQWRAIKSGRALRTVQEEQGVAER
ncbi:MAG TPA: TRAP transporter permease [Chloroflexota bacterium]|nr:TRAP transporter permease [Chloroflexota bacterium]